MLCPISASKGMGAEDLFKAGSARERDILGKIKGIHMGIVMSLWKMYVF